MALNLIVHRVSIFVLQLILGTGLLRLLYPHRPRTHSFLVSYPFCKNPLALHRKTYMISEVSVLLVPVLYLNCFHHQISFIIISTVVYLIVGDLPVSNLSHHLVWVCYLPFFQGLYSYISFYVQKLVYVIILTGQWNYGHLDHNQFKENVTIVCK